MSMVGVVRPGIGIATYLDSKMSEVIKTMYWSTIRMISVILWNGVS